MNSQFRDISVAPLPVKEKERRARQSKYPMKDIAVGGARVFPAGDKPRNARSSIYQAARKFASKYPDFKFKVVLDEAAGEVWVYRLSPQDQETPADSTVPPTKDVSSFDLASGYDDGGF